MDPLHLAHLAMVFLWGGLVAAEIVAELAAGASDPATAEPGALRAVARFHYVVDVALEIPLLAGVLITGTVLASRSWPQPPAHLVKIAFGLIAITLNAV